MIGDRIIKPTPVLKEGPAVIAEKVLTAVVDWRAAEPRAAEATTALGTAPVSSVATFFESKNHRASR